MKSTQIWPTLHIGDLHIPVPIFQGGMGVGVSMSVLAAAVARAGAVGLIATAGVGRAESDLAANFLDANRRALRSEIRKARADSDGLIGVNIMAALTNHEDLARTAVEEGVDLIVSGAGLPMNLPAVRPAGCRTKLVPIVSSGRAATLLARRWQKRFGVLPDAFVVEGPLAGGHLGFSMEQIDDPAYSLENLTVDVLAHCREIEARHGQHIPVIAAGGIYTGADIRRFLDMGAEGVQLGTRFVTTRECDASTAFKNAYIAARKEDITLIRSPVGLPGRVIRNAFTEAVEQGKRKAFRCPFHCILTCDPDTSPYCIANALLNARNGAFSRGFAFAGANAWRATEITTVPELMDTLRKEYAEAAGLPQNRAQGGQ